MPEALEPVRAARAGRRHPFGQPGKAPRFDEEDAVTQNQLTLVTTIGPGGQARVEAVMALIDGYSRHLAPPGSLMGICTIHFVRWLVIDEGRRLVMLSDYDGSWEAYIDEFAEMILSGLDAIWGTALGYPPEARATSRPSSASCAATRCPLPCSTAAIPSRPCSTSSATFPSRRP